MAQKFVRKDNHKFWNYAKNMKHIHTTYTGPRIFVAILIILFVIGAIYYFVPFKSIQSISKEGGQEAKIEQVNLVNLPDYLERASLVRDLPKSSVISVVVGENYFTIRKNNVQSGKAEKPDLEIWFNEKYLDSLGKDGICKTASKAKESGDFSLETFISEPELLWKYSGMIKYKDCLSL